MKKFVTCLLGAIAHFVSGEAYAASLDYNVSSTFASGGKIIGSITLNNTAGIFTAANLNASGFKISNGNYSVAAIQGPDFLTGYDLDVVPPGFGPELEFVFAPDSFIGYTASTIPVDSLYFNSGLVFDNEFATSTMVTLVPSSVGSVPEPATWGMIMLGMGVVGYALRRRPSVRFSHAA